MFQHRFSTKSHPSHSQKAHWIIPTLPKVNIIVHIEHTPSPRSIHGPFTRGHLSPQTSSPSSNERGQLSGIQLTPASRYIELSQFYEDGELVEFGGYEQKYKSIFTPVIKDTADVAKPFQPRFIGQGTRFIGKTDLPNCWVYNPSETIIESIPTHEDQNHLPHSIYWIHAQQKNCCTRFSNLPSCQDQQTMLPSQN